MLLLQGLVSPKVEQYCTAVNDVVLMSRTRQDAEVGEQKDNRLAIPLQTIQSISSQFCFPKTHLL